MASSNPNKKLFDPLRNAWLVRKHEEQVRQALLSTMLQTLGYPKERVLVERSLARLPNMQPGAGLPNRRLDIVCYYKDGEGEFSPLLAIECKHTMINPEAFEQLFGYNHYLHAPYLAVASSSGVVFRYLSANDNVYRYLNYLPSYLNLITARKCQNDHFHSCPT